MCNYLDMSLFGRNNMKDPMVRILLPKIKHKLIDETKKGGKKKIDHEQNYRRLTANR